MIGISPEVPILLFWIPKKGSADSTGAQHLLVLGLELLIFIAHFVFMYLDKANYAWKKTETDWTTKHFIDSLTFRLDGWQPAPMRGEKIGFWQNIVQIIEEIPYLPPRSSFFFWSWWLSHLTSLFFHWLKNSKNVHWPVFAVGMLAKHLSQQ